MAKLLINDTAVSIAAESRSKSLLELSLDSGIQHQHICGGKARCSTCRVRVLDGGDKLAPRTPEEEALAKKRGFDDDIRLACQSRLKTDASGPIHLATLIRDKLDVDMVSHGADAARVREKDLVVLFSDLRDFTTFSEKHLPYDTVHILNRYFASMGAEVKRHGGVIDKYMGDGLMALFGLGEPEGATCETVRLGAIKAALGMLTALDDFNAYLTKSGYTCAHFQMGIGLHRGMVVHGAMGHTSKVMETAIGDAVNVASRLESATKDTDASLLISDDLFKSLPGRLETKGCLEITLKGRSEPTTAHKVVGVI